jgi:hypothetical protein
VWDITRSGLNDNMRDAYFSYTSNGQAMNTVFGLTTTRADGSATISDISFYTRDSLVTRYPEMQTYLGAPDNSIHQTQPVLALRGIYTLDGRNVTHLPTLITGIYIIDGKLRFVGNR